MRWAALTLVLLSLAGCVADFFGPSTPTAPQFAFDPGGIQQIGSDLRIDFGRAQEGAIESASRLFGSLPDDVIAIDECGAGRVVAARWPGVTLNFLGGDFVGWVLGAPGLPANGLTVGQPQNSLPPVTLAETTLGTEFEVNGVFGLILPGEAEIAQLWSGTSCFFR